MDNLQHFRRTDYCGTFTAANVGQEISVSYTHLTLPTTPYV